MKRSFVAAIGLAAVALAACSQIAGDINLGSASANSQLIAVAAKIDAGIAVVQSDIPALCAIAANAATIGAAASSLSSNTTLAKAANGAGAASNSALCAQGLTGTASDAATLANSIKAVSNAVKTPAAQIATPAGAQ